MNDKKNTLMWKKGTFLIIIISIMNSMTAEVQGQSLYDSRRMLLSGRGIALARAYVADISEASCMLMNPAALTYLRDYSVSSTFYHEMDNQMLAANAIVPWAINKRHAIGIGLMKFSFGQIQYGADLAYSYRISAPVSAGIILQPRIGINSISKVLATTMGFGIIYAPSSGVRYGFSVLGIGNSLDFYPISNYFVLARKTKVALGISMNFPSWLKRPVMNLTASTERFVGENNFRYSIGLEISPIEFLDVRAGLLTGHSDDPQKDHGLSFGVGIKSRIFIFDYGVGQSIFGGKFHQISLRTQVAKIFQ